MPKAPTPEELPKRGNPLAKKKKRRKPMHPNSLQALRDHKVDFKKNNPITGEKDPRINRKGAPDTTSNMRALIRDLGADLVALREVTRAGKPKTRIVSRITKKLLDMYDSSNPADNAAILKAGWPGILDDEGNKRPNEVVLRIVYENKREVPGEEELIEDADVLDGEENKADKSDRGIPIIAATVADDRWSLQDLTHETDVSTAGKENNDKESNDPEEAHS